MESRLWLVIARDNTLPCFLIFLVRAVSNIKARERVKKEYQKQGWGTPTDVDAYRLPTFRGNQDALQVCKLFDPSPQAEQPTNEQPKAGRVITLADEE
jgi:hypothetical protein